MSAIQPGDLVVVVGAICKCTEVEIGHITTVISLEHAGTECFACHETASPTLTAKLFGPDGLHAWKPLSYLRKIEPLAEDETVEREAEVVA